MEEFLKEVDQLEDERNYEEIQKRLEKPPVESVETWWRRSRCSWDLANNISDTSKKQKLFQQGVEEAETAIRLDPNHYAGHKWWAINQSSLGDYISIKEKISGSFKIREAAQKAADLKPTDATTQHFLGRWCYAVSNVGWLERKAASALFATPPESTFEEALKYFIKADELDPKHTVNIFWLGEAYFQLGKKKEAKAAYSRLLEETYVTNSEKKLQEDAKAKIKKC